MAGYSQGQIRVIDRIREMVRLAAGLDEHDNLDAMAQARALDCLARFGERLRDIPAERLRVVGTNTLRKASNPEEFVAKAQELLGHRIDIISGIEEARLIYVGASRSMPAVEGQQLFVDIGGGSTELAAGEGFQPRLLESLPLGCVAMSQRHFADGQLTAEAFRNARVEASLELRPIAQRFRTQNWESVAGASGTIRAAGNVLQELGIAEQAITPDGLRQLIDHMLVAGAIDKLDYSSMSPQRLPVFPGGIAILAEVMLALNIRELTVTQGALREGILFDLIGRSTEEDARTRTVRAMEKRYHIDTEQADRVELTAIKLLEFVADDWQLNVPGVDQLLRWAARLHEIGLDIAHAQYHRHGAYLLEHSDMSGFDRSLQLQLASLVESHRRSLANNDMENIFVGGGKLAVRLAVILRLAVLFNRSRTYEFPDLLGLTAHDNKIGLRLSGAWLEDNPLTLADLEREREYLAAVDIDLELLRI